MKIYRGIVEDGMFKACNAKYPQCLKRRMTDTFCTCPTYTRIDLQRLIDDQQDSNFRFTKNGAPEKGR